MNDGRRIQVTNPSKLTADDIRHLSTWLNNQREDWWYPLGHGGLTLAKILRCYHAANDAGYAGLDEWHSNGKAERERCLETYRAIVYGIRRNNP